MKKSICVPVTGFEWVDDFQFGNLQSGLTVLDVLYSDPAPPIGPISLGLACLPDSIPATFILDGIVSGATTFGLADVLLLHSSGFIIRGQTPWGPIQSQSATGHRLPQAAFVPRVG